MKTELKVASQPLAKRMKELGWDYETERYWYKLQNRNKIIYVIQKNYWEFVPIGDGPSYLTEKLYRAPDAIEIGERLPESINNKDDLVIRKDIDNYYNIYYGNLMLLTGLGLSEALGEMWCYLKEKGLI